MRSITRREAIKKGGRLFLGAATCSLLPGFATGCSNQALEPGMVAELMQKTKNANLSDIRLSVIYNNVPSNRDMRTDWGFACLIEGLDKTIIFDAGRYDDLFMTNLSKLKVDPHQIDDLFISHDHPDHIGGTLKLLDIRHDIDISLVHSFPSGFKSAIKKMGANVIETDQPCIVSAHCLSTGEMQSFVKNEQALVIRTDEGSIILTGCAHPGVVEIVERAQQITRQNVLLVMGGFHLLMDDASSIRTKAARLKGLGVRYVAPSHCTGGEAIKILAEIYGDRFIDSGVGRIITAKDIA